MAVTVSGTQITFNDSTTQSTAAVATAQAKAWININNQSNVASYNVSSITRNATADYTINFTNAFSDSNYIMVSAGCAPNNIGTSEPKILALTGTGDPPTLKSTTQVRVGLGSDGYSCGMAFFR